MEASGGAPIRATLVPPAVAYRADIDGMRGLAVAFAVLFHAELGIVPGGFVGVDMFFVISGYLITGIVLREMTAGRFSIADFYVRRVRRIFPALFVCLAVVTLAGLVLLLPSELADLGSSVAATAVFASNILLWSQTNYFDADAWTKPLLHTWSLAVEEQFYLVWPPLLYAVVRLGWTRHLLWIIAGSTVVSLAAAEWMAGHSPTTAFYMAPLRGWELLAGAMLVIVPGRLHGRWTTEAMAALGLLLILVPAALYGARMRFPGLSAVPPVLGTMLLIEAGRTARPAATRLLSSMPAVAIGLISYSLYLWHWPVLVFANIELGRALTDGESIVAIGVALVLAIVSWRFVERPFHQFKRGGGGTTTAGAGRVAPVLWTGLAAMVAALAIGYALRLDGGFPMRVPAAAAALDGYRDPWALTDVDCVVRDDAPGDLDRCLLHGKPLTAPTTLIWGDSHALHHVETLRARFAGGDERLLILMGFGCLPLPGVRPVLGLGREDTRCALLNDMVPGLLARHPEIDRIMLIGRWSNLVFDTEGGRHPTSRYLLDAAHPRRTPADTTAAFALALERLIARLDRTGTQTILLKEGTEFPRVVPQCLARAVWRGHDAARCGVARAALESRHAPVDRVIEGLTRRHPRLRVYDQLPALCPGSWCRADSPAGLLTRDAHHLSDLGSRVALADLPLAPRKRPGASAH